MSPPSSCAAADQNIMTIVVRDHALGACLQGSQAGRHLQSSCGLNKDPSNCACSAAVWQALQDDVQVQRKHQRKRWACTYELAGGLPRSIAASKTSSTSSLPQMRTQMQPNLLIPLKEKSGKPTTFGTPPEAKFGTSVTPNDTDFTHDDNLSSTNYCHPSRLVAINGMLR